MRLPLLPSIGCLLASLLTPTFAQDAPKAGTDPSNGQIIAPVPSAKAPDISGQSAADNAGRLTFHSQSILIEVPAVIVDKAGRHVHNLTKDDFRILEEGKQQQIAVFEEITTSGGRIAQPTNSASTFSNVALDSKQRPNVTVIALDRINSPFLDQAYGRQQLLKYLSTILDSDAGLALVAIGTKGIQVLSPLNSDTASVIAALKKTGGEISSMEAFSQDARALSASSDRPLALVGGQAGDATDRMRRFILTSEAIESGFQQPQAIEQTLKSFLSIALSLSGIPGRKSLIWATGRFPFFLDSPSSLPTGNLAVLYERTLHALNDAQISVYPVDVRGLVSLTPVGVSQNQGGYWGERGGELALSAAGRSWLEGSTIDSLKTFASMTGGRAFFSNNDLITGFKRAAEDSSSYYMIGYYRQSQNSKPGWRKLQVQVAPNNVLRSDLDVRARTGFLVTQATNQPQLTHDADIEFALASPFDSTGIPVTVQLRKESSAGGKTQVRFSLRVPASGMIDEEDSNRFNIDFLARATKSGVQAGNTGETIKGTIPSASLAGIKAEGITYKNTLELPTGDYQVRFLVRDNLQGRVGSITVPLLLN